MNESNPNPNPITVIAFEPVSIDEVSKILQSESEENINNIVLSHNNEINEKTLIGTYKLVGIQKIGDNMRFIGYNSCGHNFDYFVSCAKRINIETNLTIKLVNAVKTIDPNANYIAMNNSGECYSFHQKPIYNFGKWTNENQEFDAIYWKVLNNYMRQSKYSLIKIADYLY